MTLGRPKDFKCSVETLEKMRQARVVYWASEKGLVHRKKLSDKLKVKWAVQKSNGVSL